MEIKFRAWHTEEKEYFYLNKTGYLGGTDLLDQYLGHEKAIWEQFSGLQDKNGNDIYAGDIVKTVALLNDHNQRGSTSVSKVYFEGGCFCLAPDNFEVGVKLFDMLLCCSVEIIGNIHENPELIDE